MAGKKITCNLIFLVAALLLSASFSLGGMTALEDMELSEIKGQVGLTIDIALEATSGYLSLMDFDGFPDDTNPASDKACVTLGDFWANGGTANTPVTGTGWKIDVGSDGASSYLILVIGTLTNDDDSGWGFDSLKIGTEPNTGLNIGKIAMTGIQMGDSTIRIEPIP
ncbi:MAG: hypothetical protein JEZ02_19105 [Desulfatibacillum sp.]|nr:hypothetical protein [Desulfatibacillum sp.]